MNVGSNFPAPVTLTNSASVFNHGDVNSQNNGVLDPTNIIPPPPDLTITKSHTGNFNQGQSAAYTLTVNNIGAGPTFSQTPP